MSHYMIKCKICDTIVEQCRCPGDKNVRFVVCSACRCRADKRPQMKKDVAMMMTPEVEPLLDVLNQIIDERMAGGTHEDDDAQNEMWIAEEVWKMFYGKTLNELCPHREKL